MSTSHKADATMNILLSLILSLTILSVKAQTALVPGENSFQKQWIKETSYRMRWIIEKDTAEIKVGDVLTNISIDKGELTIITTVKMYNVEGLWIDTTVADLHTLSPIRHSSYNLQRNMSLKFGSELTGIYYDKIKKQETSVSDSTSTKYFDSNLYPKLITWLPLADGYRKDISIYDFNPYRKTGIMKASILDVKSGVFQSISSGIQPVWIVSVVDEIGQNTNSLNVYYIGKHDRKLWRQEVTSGSRKMVFSLVEQSNSQ